MSSATKKHRRRPTDKANKHSYSQERENRNRQETQLPGAPPAPELGSHIPRETRKKRDTECIRAHLARPEQILGELTLKDRIDRWNPNNDPEKKLLGDLLYELGSHIPRDTRKEIVSRWNREDGDIECNLATRPIRQAKNNGRRINTIEKKMKPSEFKPPQNTITCTILKPYSKEINPFYPEVLNSSGTTHHHIHNNREQKFTNNPVKQQKTQKVYPRNHYQMSHKGRKNKKYQKRHDHHFDEQTGRDEQSIGYARLEQTKTRNKKVHFGAVEIRYYERSLGNHELASPDGPSLSLGDRYVSGPVMPISQYESDRSSRKSRKLKPLPGKVRYALIQSYTDYTLSQIERNIDYLRKARRRRHREVRERQKEDSERRWIL